MKAAVVFESMYGNTHSIARAVAEGLGSAAATEVVSAAEAGGLNPADLDLLVVGGPTHAHSMSRPKTRDAAVSGAAGQGLTLDPSAEGPGLREWFEALAGGTGRAAAFDTRMDAPELLTGRASKGISKRLKQHGYDLLAGPESFLVGKDSALRPGEQERARRWGEKLAKALNSG